MHLCGVCIIKAYRKLFKTVFCRPSVSVMHEKIICWASIGENFFDRDEFFDSANFRPKRNIYEMGRKFAYHMPTLMPIILRQLFLHFGGPWRLLLPLRLRHWLPFLLLYMGQLICSNTHITITLSHWKLKIR